MIGCVLNFLDAVSLLDLALALIEKGRRILPYILRNAQRKRVLLPRWLPCWLPFAEDRPLFFLTSEYFLSGETSMNRVRVMIRAKTGGKYLTWSWSVAPFRP